MGGGDLFHVALFPPFPVQCAVLSCGRYVSLLDLTSPHSPACVSDSFGVLLHTFLLFQ